MPLNDLTPQLRTRLNRMEKSVGLFVTVATFIMLVLLAYYIYRLAKDKGWFLAKIQYMTAVADASGIDVASPIKLMGKDVGEVTKVEVNLPDAYYNITVFFNVRAPYYGYVWTDSKVQVVADMLGHRSLQIVRGNRGQTATGTVLEQEPGKLRVLDHKQYKALYGGLLAAETNRPAGDTNRLPSFHQMVERSRELADQAVKADLPKYYLSPTNIVFIDPDETPDLMTQLADVAKMVHHAVPGILSLTNLVSELLVKAGSMEQQITGLVADTRPVVSNLAVATANLREPRGSLGQWLIPTNTQAGIDVLLRQANRTIGDTDTNLTLVLSNLDLSLANMGVITSNLSAQVAANTNILSRISSTVLDSDTFIQGLKRHWLLRSAFKPVKTNSSRARPR